MKIKYIVPPTMEQGSCTIIGRSSLTETAKDNALWEYNDMRAHDGQRPVTSFPVGTIIQHIIEEHN